MGKSKPLSQSVLVGPWELMLPAKRLSVDGLRCEWGPGRVLLLDSFLWIWDGKKPVILTAFFFTLFHEMDPSNSQSTAHFCLCLLCGYGGAAVWLLWSFGNFIPHETLICWVHSQVLSPSVSPLRSHVCVCTRTRTHTHPYHPPKHRV